MRIAVAGYGIEGETNYQYWTQKGDDVTIVDEKANPDRSIPDTALRLLGPGAFSRLQDFDMVVRTASLNPGRLATHGKIWSATNEFFEKCPAPIIGVTGTKGKGTTCSFIASILRASGKTVHLVGNIGTPALAQLPRIKSTDIVVYELSSFQLWDLKRSPQTAVILMIEPDHLNVHLNMEDYVKAKSHIRAYQDANDMCWYHPKNEYARQIAESTRDGRAAPYNAPNVMGSVYVRDGSFWVNEREICTIDSVVIPGEHNLENACAAISASLGYIDDFAHVEAGLRSFTGLPHRLKFVREFLGVRYYDDSISTTPGSAIAAMASFSRPKILLIGGQSKGGDYQSVIETAARLGVKVVCFGENTQLIAQLCEANQVEHIALKKNADMREIVKRADELASPGDVVILSPAGASFDMYGSYAERGEAFIAAVNFLAENDGGN